MRPATAPVSIIRKLPLFLDAIRFQETIFALPFAYSGMIIAADGLPNFSDFLWITVAMIGARTLGMSANRIIDQHIDSDNPRTSMRHLPLGILRTIDMMVLSLLGAILLFVSAWRLNPLAIQLAPVAAIYLAVYPFAKRFTWLSSFILGWALAIAPSAAWIGIKGSLSWEPVLLSVSVAAWATSFDILYHVQDRDFYIERGLHSVAQQFGIKQAFLFSRILDLIAIVCLVAVGILIGLSFPYFIGCLIAAGLLFYRRRMVSPENLGQINIAFMRINAYVSITIFTSVIIAILIS